MRTPPMKCVSALSTVGNTESALADVLGRAAGGLAGERADLALIFGSSHHAGGLGRIAREVRGRGLARHVLGCTGESIVGEGREVEGAPALSLWAIRMPGVDLSPCRFTCDGEGVLASSQPLEPAGAADP